MLMEEINSIIEEAIGINCDNNCKWPALYRGIYEDPDEAHEKMLYDRCELCAMTLLVERLEG